MSSASIQVKIKKGLSKARVKAGSLTALKVYLLQSVTTQGTPLAPGTTTTTEVELNTAIFTSYDAKIFNENILAGDRRLVCDNTTAITQGDVIKQGAVTYLAISVEIKAPTSDVLAYIVQLRAR